MAASRVRAVAQVFDAVEDEQGLARRQDLEEVVQDPGARRWGGADGLGDDGRQRVGLAHGRQGDLDDPVRVPTRQPPRELAREGGLAGAADAVQRDERARVQQVAHVQQRVLPPDDDPARRRGGTGARGALPDLARWRPCGGLEQVEHRDRGVVGFDVQLGLQRGGEAVEVAERLGAATLLAQHAHQCEVAPVVHRVERDEPAREELGAGEVVRLLVPLGQVVEDLDQRRSVPLGGLDVPRLEGVALRELEVLEEGAAVDRVELEEPHAALGAAGAALVVVGGRGGEEPLELGDVATERVARR